MDIGSFLDLERRRYSRRSVGRHSSWGREVTDVTEERY
jgi:hypothetical protein